MMILHDGHGKFLEIEMIGKNGVAWEADFLDLSSNPGDIIGDDPFFDQLKDPYKTTWRAAGIIHFGKESRVGLPLHIIKIFCFRFKARTN